MTFKGKTVIVTGAAKGIGKCIAQTYAQHGANVVIADIDKVEGKKTERKILKAGHKAVFIETDVSDAHDVYELVHLSCGKYGNIDILINNAGISRFTPIFELTVDAWDEIINTNLRGTFLCSREVAKIMRISGKGSIVNIASTRAFMSEPDSEAYAASKGAIISLTHALAASLAKDHIQVNCISPGWIETANYELLKKEDHSQHFAGRVGKPEDIANACLYLTSDGNDFISGTNIVIDGGMTKKMMYV
jgi:NAD(P)-dependent dehydrogenase (short-subunit alcohol dehydrogenase family)